jgi:hypothetical protein
LGLKPTLVGFSFERIGAIYCLRGTNLLCDLSDKYTQAGTEQGLEIVNYRRGKVDGQRRK